jgi:hypothetical protein
LAEDYNTIVFDIGGLVLANIFAYLYLTGIHNYGYDHPSKMEPDRKIIKPVDWLIPVIPVVRKGCCLNYFILI